ncbi:uncharacterized protein F4807DRAFT_425689, partial [Annulohypoxylon truncatum]|uniref:uncharacterized protein n=1 Tax=Annulohypoxylon truncatum TaxID=327061 RepID=UPI002008CC98
MKNMDPSILQATPSEPALHVCIRSLCENPPALDSFRCAYHEKELEDAIAERKRKRRLRLCCYTECYEPRFENEIKCEAHLENPGIVCSTEGCYNPVPENRKICLYHAERARENYVIRTQRAREGGVCMEGRCNEPSAPGILRCPKHAKRRNEANKSYRYTASNGFSVCSFTACQELPVEDATMCKRHLEHKALQNRKLRESRRAKGLCTCCNQPRASESKAYCLKHLTNARERGRKIARLGRLRLKQEREELKNAQRSENP